MLDTYRPGAGAGFIFWCHFFCLFLLFMGFRNTEVVFHFPLQWTLDYYHLLKPGLCFEILSNIEHLCEDQCRSFNMGADTCTHKSLLLFLLSSHNSTLIINSYLHSIGPTFPSSLFFYVFKGESHSQIIGS